jgi:hypothetical protein
MRRRVFRTHVVDAEHVTHFPHCLLEHRAGGETPDTTSRSGTRRNHAPCDLPGNKTKRRVICDALSAERLVERAEREVKRHGARQNEQARRAQREHKPQSGSAEPPPPHESVCAPILHSG